MVTIILFKKINILKSVINRSRILSNTHLKPLFITEHMECDYL